MPIIKSAVKRVKQTIVRRERNVATKKAIKGATKAFDAKPTAESLSKAHSELDKALKKGLLKKNTVARRKAALAKQAKEAGVKLASGTKKAAATPAAAKKAPVKAAAKPATKKPAAKPAAKKPAAKK